MARGSSGKRRSQAHAKKELQSMSAIVWMDMEMSGLEPETERILEVAVLVTDGELKVVAEGPNLVLHQPDAVLEAMDEWNTSHHGQSGLTKRVRESTIDETQASAALLAFLAEHTKKRKAPLAGNSIHQDRRFVARYLPEVEDWLHYRNVDVSTIKELAQRWYPKRYSGRPTKKGSHRAMDDLLESIEELKYYRKALFLPTDS
ncbi:MAG: oligoribonuclease [Deltaproteobacteria bacterium]|nr:oligoribonuclease [Deltaproteobacteria bacterium]MBW2404478.1 oligoribonuclease [Deltaproteobacteria bacterium]MBW2589074.1 oligoribonuclease [Deltaproteobacteria bacterium]